MPKVKFLPSGRSHEVRTGNTILSAANGVGLPIGQSCSGEGICGWCKVTIVNGLENLDSPSGLERKLIVEKEFGPSERAACLAVIGGNVWIISPIPSGTKVTIVPPEPLPPAPAESAKPLVPWAEMMPVLLIAPAPM